jgi:hypothetical protein
MSAATTPTPSPAERIRTLLAGARRAHLATVLSGGDGHPTVTAVNVGVDDAGAPYTYLSTLTDVSRNLAADPRASLSFGASIGAGGDVADAPAAMAVGELHVVVGAADELGLRDRYVAAHPYAGYVRFCDFVCWRMEVERFRLIPGFGRPRWVPAADVRAAEADPLAPFADAVVGELNRTSADALMAWARAAGAIGASDVATATACGIDRYGVDVLAWLPTGRRTLRLPFDHPVASSIDAGDATTTIRRHLHAAVQTATDRRNHP